MNTNAQAVRFCNEVVRQNAEKKLGLYFSDKAMVDTWNGQNLSSVIPNDSTVIDDRATEDGRPIATNSGVTNIITRAIENIADMEANSNAKLNTLIALAETPR
jgi:hypothetical protein